MHARGPYLFRKERKMVIISERAKEKIDADPTLTIHQAERAFHKAALLAYGGERVMVNGHFFQISIDHRVCSVKIFDSEECEYEEIGEVGDYYIEGDRYVFKKEFHTQGRFFKSHRNWDLYPIRDDLPVYVPEYSKPGEFFSVKDFLRICNQDEHMAENIFDMVDWQQPETLLQEILESESVYNQGELPSFAEFYDNFKQRDSFSSRTLEGLRTLYDYLEDNPDKIPTFTEDNQNFVDLDRIDERYKQYFSQCEAYDDYQVDEWEELQERGTIINVGVDGIIVEDKE